MSTPELFHFEFQSPQPEDPETLNLITKIVGSLSFLGCIFNIAVTVYFGKSKVTIGKMVIILAFLDLLTYIPIYLSSFHSLNTQYTCEVIGCWFAYFGYTAALFFTTSFAHALYHTLMKSTADFVDVYFKKYIAISVIAGLIVGTFSVIFQFKQHFNYPDGNLCSVRPYSGFDWKGLILIFLPGVLNLVGCTVYYIRIIKLLRSINQRLHLGLLVYPLILVICIAPFLVQRFLSFFGGKIQGEFFMQMTRGCYAAQGLLNSLAYGLSREIYEGFKRCCSKPRRLDPLMKSFTSDDGTLIEAQLPEDSKPIN